MSGEVDFYQRLRFSDFKPNEWPMKKPERENYLTQEEWFGSNLFGEGLLGELQYCGTGSLHDGEGFSKIFWQNVEALADAAQISKKIEAPADSKLPDFSTIAVASAATLVAANIAGRIAKSFVGVPQEATHAP